MRVGLKAMLAGCICAAVVAVAQADAVTSSAHARVDALFAPLTRHGSPGCAVGVVKDGRLDYARGYGLANVELDVPIRADRTVFDIASMSKQFTAASVLILARDGKLSLQDDVHRYLPQVPEFGQRITIDELLHHTSGVRDYVGMMFVGDRHHSDYTDAQDVMDFLSRQKALDFAPGTDFDYSNSNYFLLARIVEKVSGQGFAQFVQERLFQPLGMVHSQVVDAQETLIPGRAAGYLPAPGGQFANVLAGWVENGAHGVFTTIGDLARWDENFYTLRIGGDAWRRLMLQPGRLIDGTRLDYAAGLRLGNYRGLPIVEHAGDDFGYRSQLLRFPTEHFSAVVLCNTMLADPDRLTRQVADIYLAGRFRDAPHVAADPAPVTGQNAHLVGTYWNAGSAILRRVEARDGKLWYVRSPMSREPLVADGPGRFHVGEAGERAAVVFDGQVLRLAPSHGKEVRLRKVATPKPSSVHPDAYTGVYASSEFQTRWVVAVAGAQLTLRGWRDAPGDAQPLDPVFNDAFMAGPMVLRFRRDGSGHVTGLLVDSSRARHLVFDRVSPQAGLGNGARDNSP